MTKQNGELAAKQQSKRELPGRKGSSTPAQSHTQPAPEKPSEGHRPAAGTLFGDQGDFEDGLI